MAVIFNKLMRMSLTVWMWHDFKKQFTNNLAFAFFDICDFCKFKLGVTQNTKLLETERCSSLFLSPPTPWSDPKLRPSSLWGDMAQPFVE